MNKKKKKGIFSRLFEVSPEGKGLLALSSIASAGGMLFGIVPFLSVYYIGRNFLVPEGPDSSNILFWAIVAGLSVLLNMILTFAGSIGAHVVAFKLLFNYRIQVMEHMGKVSMGFFSKNTSGSIQKTMDENIENIEMFIAHMFPDFVGSTAVLIALFLGIAYLNIFMALAVLISVFIAFMFQFIIFGTKKSKQIWVDVIQANQSITGAFSQYVRGMAEVKLFGQTGELTGSLNKHIGEFLHWELKSYKRSSVPMSLYKSIVLSLLTFVLPLGIIIIEKSPTPNTVMAVLMTLIIIPSIFDPLITCVQHGTQMGMFGAGLEQIDHILSQPVLSEMDCVKEKSSSKEFSTTQKGLSPSQSQISDNQWDVVFDNVNFSYQDSSDPQRQMALQNINFHAKKGEITALVGESGSGKSTIANLLLRFWDIHEGSIKIGNTDIKHMKYEILMDSIAAVFQDTYLFADTIKGNISMNRDFPEEKIISAAKKARCHDFISALPEGYNTKVGSGNIKLSGGEIQRISIARAILKEAPIVILDEALAYTDAENENLIHMAIKNLVKDKTLIVIAHHLRSIVDANQIIVMQKGEIIESGTHHTLMSKASEYKNLWDIQNKASRWKIEKETSQ